MSFAEWSLVIGALLLSVMLTSTFFGRLPLSPAMIYLGLKALEHDKRDAPTFKEGLKTGLAISLVYGLTNEART